MFNLYGKNLFLFCTGFYFNVPEITPNAVGLFRFNGDNEMVKR